MKKGVVAGIAVIILIILFVFVFGKKKSVPETSAPVTNANPNMTANKASSSSATKSNASQSEAAEVEIDDFAYKSNALTVKAGTKVTWTNKDSAAHTVSFDSKGMTETTSGTMNQNDTYSYTFDTVGSFSYHCAFHPAMTGTVTVTN